MVGVSVQAAVWYVTPGGAGLADGSSWDNAYSNVADAVTAAAAAGSEIRLQYGTYSNAAEIAISAYPDFVIRGGYAGTPADPTALTNLPSVITRQTAVNIRLFNLNASTVTWERVTLTGGYLTTGNGAAISLTNRSRVVITNCTVQGNGFAYAAKGGGVYVQGSILEAVDSIFAGNYIDADSENAKLGGAVACENGTSSFIRVQFLGNRVVLRHSTAYGGALYLSGGQALIDQCDFLTNRAVSYQHADYPYGGALYAVSVPSLVVTNSRFRENYASGQHCLANAIFLTGASLNGDFNSCVIENQGLGAAQDIYLDAAGTVAFRHSTLQKSPVTSLVKAGAGTLTLTNCLMVLNAGAAVEVRAGTMNIANSTVADNGGWGVTNSSATVAIKDCIVWNNSLGDITGTVTATYSGLQSTRAGTGNLTNDPLFIAGYYLSVAGQPFQPSSSPCLNVGSDQSSTLGLSGRTTAASGGTDSGVVDLGYHPTSGVSTLSNLVLYVNASSGSDSNDGWSSGNALKTIGSALGRVLAGGRIEIAAGSYTNGVGAESFPLVVNTSHVTLNGAGPDATLIDALGSARVLTAINPGRMRLENLRIANGYLLKTSGGGLYLVGGDVRLTNCVFSNNRVSNNSSAPPSCGAGIYASGSRLALWDCLFLTNRVEQNGYCHDSLGGAIYASASVLDVRRCRFIQNYVSAKHFINYGGALALSGGQIDLTDSVFFTNRADAVNVSSVYHYGGAIYASGINPLNIERCTFAGNYVSPGTPAAAGGAVYIDGAAGSGRVFRCTFFTNGASGFLGDIRLAGGVVRFENNLVRASWTRGLSVGGGTADVENCTLTQNTSWGLDVGAGTVTLRNTILWNNTGGDLNGTMTVLNSCSTGLTAGVNGNINSDPLFEGAVTGNFSLVRGSLAINGGQNRSWMAGALDLAGETRIKMGVVDMGAYEAPAALPGIMIEVF